MNVIKLISLEDHQEIINSSATSYSNSATTYSRILVMKRFI